MSQQSQTYFTCTLGEASQVTLRPSFTTINDLLQYRAEHNAEQPAVGIYYISDGSKKEVAARCLTFRELYTGLGRAADLLSKALENQTKPHFTQSMCIALLMQSSPEFLFVWLGMIRLGYSVLLLAPQLSPAAIAHLCRTCQANVLFTDHHLSDLALRTVNEYEAEGEVKALLVLQPDFDLNSILADTSLPSDPKTSETEKSGDKVAYIHHTSGTSSGLPKPIPQTHLGAVGVVPVLDGTGQATFTTTPLYHGGPADILRAWSSSALIWLFPSHALPVTAGNVCMCIEASTRHNQVPLPPIKYFTSVPYVLQMMASDDRGAGLLKGMDLVGVGGAALPQLVGDDLVAKGIKLVSRFGSAECGFLLSSHRDYENDNEWQFLRHLPSSNQISFEEREDGLSELIVGKKWAHLAKHNRNDGSFATADLFEPHKTIEHAWRYHSRADAQIALIIGKKFDPTPIEHDLVASLDDVMDALVFGEGQPYPGVLLFPASKSQLTSTVFSEKVLPSIQAINAKGAKHAQIPVAMARIMPFEANPLEKSSKGSIMRQRAIEKYSAVIQATYDAALAPEAIDVPDKELAGSIRSFVAEMMGGQPVDNGSDLFAQGVDSILSMQLRRRLQGLLPEDADTLPPTVVQEAATVDGLVAVILDARHGSGHKHTDAESEETILTYVEQFSQLEHVRPVESMIDGWTTIVEGSGKTVLMTGATGFLGSFVLHELIESSEISHIYVLVRGATQTAAEERVRKALISRKLSVAKGFDDKVTVMQCNLSEPDLGIPFMDYSNLQNEVDIVLHLAWSVNFLIALQSFKPHFLGIQNLLNLCLSSTKLKPPRFVLCSSVAAISDLNDTSEAQVVVPETLIPALDCCGTTGYARSKLTAELIVARAAQTTPALRHRISVIRVGQLSADTLQGVWNASEAYPQILATAKLNDGCLPDLGKSEYLSWVPVDVAAKAFIEGSLNEPNCLQNWPTEHVRHCSGKPPSSAVTVQSGLPHKSELIIDTTSTTVLHLLNPEVNSIFTDFLHIVQRVAGDQVSREQPEEIKIVAAKDWLDGLSALATRGAVSEDAKRLLRLLPFWYQVYGQASLDKGPVSGKRELSFALHTSLLAMPSLSYWLGRSTIEGCEGSSGSAVTSEIRNQLLRSDYVRKTWDWTGSNVV